MTTTERRRLGCTIRKARRHGYTKQQVLAYRSTFVPAFLRLAELYAPAIRSILALISASERRPALLHNGRKPR